MSAKSGMLVAVTRLRIVWGGLALLTEVEVGGQRIPVRLDDLCSDRAPLRVPEHESFVLGGSRGNSQDSRSWGFVPRDHVIGTYAKIP